MSEATECNYCSYKRIKKMNEAKNRIVTLTKHQDGSAIIKVNGKTICMFAELPDHCCC